VLFMPTRPTLWRNYADLTHPSRSRNVHQPTPRARPRRRAQTETSLLIDWQL